MSSRERTKYHASEAIDELIIAQRKGSSQNWLLSYLDVFVLVVMLLVTLVSISDYQKTADKKPKNLPKPAPLSAAVSNTPAPSPEPVKVSKPTPPPKPEQTPEVVANEQRLQADMNAKIQQMGLDKAVHLTIAKGYAQMEIQNKVLFRSSEAELSDSGKEVLAGIIPILWDAKGMIIIEGHTDNRPIRTARFPTNWELSAARANSVLHFLTSQELDPSRLHTAGFADTKPIADNNTPEGREKNRRVNILIKVEDKLEENNLNN